MIKRLFFLIATVAVLLTACSDNDSFTKDPSQRLSFSNDTIRLDTLFSQVPSVTYTFWIHNNSADGLRITEARLENGNLTGFRVNVDGTFLNPVGQNFEVRKGDSLRVFVEITSYETHSLGPKLVEDNLMLTLESGTVQKVNLRTYSWDAEKVTNLEVNEDMTIESEKPLVIYGDGIHIAKDATLTLRNTQLFFHSAAGILVEGRLVADNCLLRGDRLDHMFDNLPYDRVSGQWLGIDILCNATGCWLTNTEVRNAWDGIWADSTQVVLTNSVIHNCRGYALNAHDSNVVLDYVQLSNAERDCLLLQGCEAVVDHCTLAQFYPLVGGRGAALHYGPTKRDMTLNCRNTLVTGYEDNVVLSDKSDKDSFGVLSYLFENCLLRTPEVKDEEASYVNILWETSKDEFQGKQHFLTFDEDNMIYDFTISKDSPAYERLIGRAFEMRNEE